MKINAGHKKIGGLLTDLKVNYNKGGLDAKFWLYRLKWNLLPKLNIISEFPLHVIIETTNKCNLKCIMCYQRYADLDYGFMDIETFKKIIDECAAHKLASLKLSYGGEPTLHPLFFEMLDYASKKNVFLEMSFLTNATLLTKEKINKILNYNLTEIIFSVDAIKKETYEKIRVNSNFEKVMENINYLIEEKKRRGLDKPLVRIQLVKLKYNKGELDEFVTYWKQKVDYITMNDFIKPHGCEEDMSIGDIYSKQKDIETDKKQNNKNNSNNKDIKNFKACSALWQRIAILWNGEIVVCNGELKIKKDIHSNSINEIWHSHEFNEIRNMHFKGKAEEIPRCKDCGFRELI